MIEILKVYGFQKEIWLNTELTIKEKFYLGIYSQTQDIDLTEYRLSDLLCKNTIVKLRKSLVDKGLIVLYTTPEDAKAFTIKKSHTTNHCEWCGNYSYVLHEHHYPVSRKNGGKDIVHICPNCHYTYHKIYRGE